MKKIRLYILIILISLLAIIVAITYQEGKIDISKSLSYPSLQHLFGTDTLGRDLLHRVALGSLYTIMIGGSSALFSIIISFILALLALSNRVIEGIVVQFIASLKALPSLLFATLLLVIIGPSWHNLVLAISISYIPLVTRLIIFEGKKQMSTLYYDAFITLGLKPYRIKYNLIKRHSIKILLTQLPFIFASSCILESTLSFIGSGLPSETPTLGNIIKEGRSVLFTHSYIVLFPLIFLLLITYLLYSLFDTNRS